MPDRNFIVGLWSRQTNQKVGLAAGWARTLQTLTKAVDTTAGELSRLSGLATGGEIKGIFVAPEFLFCAQRFETTDKRKNQTHALGAYAKKTILDGLQSLSQANPEFLMIPGSLVFSDDVANDEEREAAKRDIIAAKTGARGKNPYKITGIDDRERLKQRYDSDLQRLDEAYETAKLKKNPHLLRHSAIVRNRTYIYLGGSVVSTYGKKAYCEDFCEDLDKGIYVPGNESGVLTRDGITLGMEICFDHQVGTLKSCRDAKDLDFHIICSAEIPNDSNMSMTKPGGFTLHASSWQAYSGVFQKMKAPSRSDKVAFDKYEKDSYTETRPDGVSKTSVGYKKIDAVKTVDVGGAQLCVYLITLA